MNTFAAGHAEQTSYWIATTPQGEPRPPLDGDITVDGAVLAEEAMNLSRPHLETHA